MKRPRHRALLEGVRPNWSGKPEFQPDSPVTSYRVTQRKRDSSLRFYSKHLVHSKRLSVNTFASRLPETLADIGNYTSPQSGPERVGRAWEGLPCPAQRLRRWKASRGRDTICQEDEGTGRRGSGRGRAGPRPPPPASPPAPALGARPADPPSLRNRRRGRAAADSEWRLHRKHPDALGSNPTQSRLARAALGFRVVSGDRWRLSESFPWATWRPDGPSPFPMAVGQSSSAVGPGRAARPGSPAVTSVTCGHRHGTALKPATITELDRRELSAAVTFPPPRGLSLRSPVPGRLCPRVPVPRPHRGTLPQSTLGRHPFRTATPRRERSRCRPLARALRFVGRKSRTDVFLRTG